MMIPFPVLMVPLFSIFVWLGIRRSSGWGPPSRCGRRVGSARRPWSADAATFIVNALQPAEVVKVVLDEDSRIEVVVPDDQLSLAIGRRGQNVRLASQLTGWDIDILTEAEEVRAPPEGIRRAHPGFHGGVGRRRSRRPVAGLGRLPLRRGASYVDPTEVAAIEGFDADTAEEIQNRAKEYLADDAELDERRRELGVADEVREIDGVTTAMLAVKVPPPLRPNTASAPTCCGSSNGGCAMFGSIPLLPARIC